MEATFAPRIRRKIVSHGDAVQQSFPYEVVAGAWLQVALALSIGIFLERPLCDLSAIAQVRLSRQIDQGLSGESVTAHDLQLDG